MKKPIITLAEFAERFSTGIEPIGEMGYVFVPYRSGMTIDDNDRARMLAHRITGYAVNSFGSCSGFTLAPQRNKKP
jgi:hypothetical protein